MKGFSFNRVWWLFLKSYTEYRRHYAALVLWSFGFPLLLAFISRAAVTALSVGSTGALAAILFSLYISFKSIMGGDILKSRFFQRQVMFILFVVVLMLIYTGNRYSSQQDIIVIDSLKVQLQKERYNVLTQSSELLNLTRQSNIEKALRENGDSALANPITPPYEIIQ